MRLKIVTVEPVYKDSYHFTTVTSTGPSCTNLLQSDLDKATTCLQWPNFGDHMVIIIDMFHSEGDTAIRRRSWSLSSGGFRQGKGGAKAPPFGG